MRLGTLFLIPALALGAQDRPSLPWEGLLPLPWQPVWRTTAMSAAPALRASEGPITLSIAADGTIRVTDAKGLVRLQEGLPGRPLRAWRDGGIPLPDPIGQWGFPAETALQNGIGGLPWCAEDFRPSLAGLCWVLDDGEAVLSVIHPATGRILFLPLPPGRDLQLAFLPDRLVVQAGRAEPGSPTRWSLPWMGLLPRLSELGPRPGPRHPGTALAPFPSGE